MALQTAETPISNTAVKERKIKTSYLTNRKINLIKQVLSEKNIEGIDVIVEVICEVMKFDPNYSEYYAKKSRENAKAQGKSTYEFFNQREYYNKNKEVISAKKAAKYHLEKSKNKTT
jgi:hypothetical protein